MIKVIHQSLKEKTPECWVQLPIRFYNFGKPGQIYGTRLQPIFKKLNRR